MPSNQYEYKGKKYTVCVGHWDKWKDPIALKMYNKPFDWLQPFWKHQVVEEYKKRVAEKSI